MIEPPRDVDELMRRARALSGRTVGELANDLDRAMPPSTTQGKGFVGELVERALGADGGSSAAPDFAKLGIELKTVPMRADGRVLESTFVATLGLTELTRLDYAASTVGKKLARVLFVPVEGRPVALADRRFGRPALFEPDDHERQTFEADYEMFSAHITRGDGHLLTGHHGAALQVRPKGRNAAVRRYTADASGEVSTVAPRGVYLRARFTQSVLERLLEG